MSNKHGLPPLRNVRNDSSNPPQVRKVIEKCQRFMSIKKAYLSLQRRITKVGHLVRSKDSALVAFQAIGVVYGDIGTSPLYVLNGIFSPSGPIPSREDVVGVCSTIFWVFTTVVIFKYGLIVLQFGTSLNEGGPFALFVTLFPRGLLSESDLDETDDNALTIIDEGAAHQSYSTPVHYTREPREDLERAEVLESPKEEKSNRSSKNKRYAPAEKNSSILHNPFVKTTLCAWALLGSAMTLADGILTPAVSVVSAAEGIAVVAPSQENNVIPIAIAILVCLIGAQSFGIGKLSVIYSPIVFVWMMFLLVTGAYNCHYFPGIWRAIDPSRMVLYFVQTGNYQALSGVMLAVTGCEALFANLGQLSKRGIQAPLFLLVYPSLMLAYLGQGAQLATRGSDVIANVFYLTIPGRSGGVLYWLGFAIGLLATIIASQAMLTATFSIVSQLVHMHAFPTVKQHFPSRNAGQVYIPSINYALGAAIIAVVGGFGSSASLTEAYGFAVATVMIITSTLVAICIVAVKGKHLLYSVAFLTIFFFVDCLLWGSTALKIPHGAWFSLAAGFLVASFLWLWTWWTHKLELFELSNQIALKDLVSAKTVDRVDEYILNEASGKSPLTLIHPMTSDVHELQRMPFVAFFWRNSGGQDAPHSFPNFLQRFLQCPGLVVFVRLSTLPVPHVPPHQALSLRRSRCLPGFYGLTYNLGWKDTLDVRRLNAVALQEIKALEQSVSGSASQPNILQERMSWIEASSRNITHIWPSYHIASRQPPDQLTAPTKLHLFLQKCWLFVRTILVEVVYRFARNAFAYDDSPFRAQEDVIRIVVTAII